MISWFLNQPVSNKPAKLMGGKSLTFEFLPFVGGGEEGQPHQSLVCSINYQEGVIQKDELDLPN